jgi:hypothetical protein
MKKNLSTAEKELAHRTDEVLFYLWDPIGVSGCPQALAEYDAYSPHVFSMLLQGRTCSEIVEYLISIEKDHMGLTSSDQSLANATREQAF